MIRKEMLEEAAAQADQAIRDSLPSPRECEHEFSSLFQKKMRRTLRKAKHPIICKLPKRVACLILVVILVSGTWLTVDAEARAAFFSWVREQYETFVKYKFTGNVPNEDDIVEYELTWLPEGYFELENHALAGSTIVIYESEAGQIIQFSYSQGEDATSLFIKSNYSSIFPIKLENVVADYYEAEDQSEANALVWMSEDGEIMFCITAYEPKDVLAKMAESVGKNSLKN